MKYKPSVTVMGSNAGRPLLRGRYRRPDHGVVFGSMTLHPERIDFFELRWKGPRWFSVSFADIEKVRWWSANLSDVNLMLKVRNGQRLRLKVHAPGLWKHQVEEQWRRYAQRHEQKPQGPKNKSYTREEIISTAAPKA